jgi:hypothetical protein
MHDSSLSAKKVKGCEQLIDYWLKYLDRDLLSFAHLSNFLDSETERLMNQTFMRTTFARELKLIAQKSDAFHPRMRYLDGIKVFVYLLLVLCLAVFVDVNFQDNVVMMSEVRVRLCRKGMKVKRDLLEVSTQPGS